MTQYLTFLVGSEWCISNLTHITEIADIAGITRSAKQPEYTLGVLQHRGRALPVVDTGRLLEQEAGENVSKQMVILNVEGVKVGLAVDQVDEVIVLSEEHSLPEYLTIVENTKLFSPKQLREVQNMASRGVRRKKIECRPFPRRAERSHI